MHIFINLADYCSKIFSLLSPSAGIFKLNNAVFSSLMHLYFKVLKVIMSQHQKSYKTMR